MSNHSFESILAWWNRLFPTVGQLTVAAFWLAIVTGIALALPYDVRLPYESLQLMHLTSDGARLFRALHYWVGQLFLVFGLAHVWEHLAAGTERRVTSGVWLRLAFSIILLPGVMILGFILKADSEGVLARRILEGLLLTLPAVGKELAFAIVGSEGDYQILYLHHAVTATIALLVVMAEHAHRLWAPAPAMILCLAWSAILSWFAPPGLHDGANPIIKGPWYFLGLQELLHWTAYPLLVVAFFLLVIGAFAALPFAAVKTRKFFVSGLTLATFVYIALLVFAWLCRGENWQFVRPFSWLVPKG